MISAATQQQSVSPPGWKRTVERMKKHGEITNPFALAWWMQKRGYKPAKAEAMLDAEDKADLKDVLTRYKRDKDDMAAGEGIYNFGPGAIAQALFEGVTPPGMEHVVKRLKEKPRIKNPWALAWWLKKRQKARGLDAANILHTPDEFEAAVVEYESLAAHGDLPDVFIQAAAGTPWAQASLLNDHMLIYQER